MLERHYKTEIENLNKSVSSVEKEKASLLEQVQKLEQEYQELAENSVEKSSENVNTIENSSQTATSEPLTEQITMTGENVLRQRIMELEKLEKHLKKQVLNHITCIAI